MGKFEASFPLDRRYASNHLWLQPDAAHPERFRTGFTAYSVRLLRDVYFLEWSVAAGTAVRSRQEIGEIESSKALSTLYAPADGTILAFNEAVLEDPTPINTDGYGAGWLFDFHTPTGFLSPDEYVEMLAGVWEQTQRILKGQMQKQ